MPAPIPALVQPVLDAYIDLAGRRVPGLLEGFYLHGSLALDAFDPRLSDIDFVAVTSRRCTPEDVAGLRAVHQEIERQYPAWPLAGSYLQWADLGRFEEDIPPVPYYHDGVFHPAGYHDVNAVTWWILKQRGIAVLGPPPEQLTIPFDWDVLRVRMIQNVNSYWRRFTTSPQRIAWLLVDDGIQWAVLGVLRPFYTLREHDITSKVGAGQYALRHTDPRWHRIIHEALNIRASVPGSAYRSRRARLLHARAFIATIIRACNA